VVVAEGVVADVRRQEQAARGRRSESSSDIRCAKRRGRGRRRGPGRAAASTRPSRTPPPALGRVEAAGAVEGGDQLVARVELVRGQLQRPLAQPGDAHAVAGGRELTRMVGNPGTLAGNALPAKEAALVGAGEPAPRPRAARNSAARGRWSCQKRGPHRSPTPAARQKLPPPRQGRVGAAARFARSSAWTRTSTPSTAPSAQCQLSKPKPPTRSSPPGRPYEARGEGQRHDAGGQARRRPVRPSQRDGSTTRENTRSPLPHEHDGNGGAQRAVAGEDPGVARRPGETR